MKFRHVSLIFVALAGCQLGGSAPAERSSEEGPPRAVTLSPNMWAFTPYGKVERPASEGPASVYNAGRAQVHQNCGANDQVCRRQWVSVSPGADQFTVKAAPPLIQDWKSRWGSVLAFYKGLNADVQGFVKASEAMNGATNTLMNTHRSEIGRISRGVEDVPQKVRAKILALAEPIKGQEMGSLASTRQTIMDLQAANAVYQKAVEAHLPAFNALVERFATYRAGEAAAMGTLTSVAQAASSADINAAAMLGQQLSTVSRAESDAAGEIIVAARRMEKLFLLVQQEHDRRTAPFAALSKDKGLPILDLTSKPSKVLGEMAGYAQGRDQRLSDGVARIAAGLHTRVEALIVRAKDLATRETVKQAAQLTASGAYLNEINRRIEGLGRVAPRSNRLRLSFLAQQYADNLAFLDLENVCKTPSSWMADGCGIAQPSLATARTFLSDKLPSILRLQTTLLQRDGVSPVLVADAAAQLAAGNLRGAVDAHDAALLASEGGTP
jgi:hypothetical protein